MLDGGCLSWEKLTGNNISVCSRSTRDFIQWSIIIPRLNDITNGRPLVEHSQTQILFNTVMEEYIFSGQYRYLQLLELKECGINHS